MWGFLSRIIDFLTDIVEGVLSIPVKIINGVKEFIIEIFVPDTDELGSIFEEVTQSVGAIVGLDNFSFDSIWGGSSAPSNITGSLNLGSYTYSGVFADFSYLAQGVEYFRPYIRAFIVFLLCIFNVRQALSMFGLSSGEIKSAARGDSE